MSFEEASQAKEIYTKTGSLELRISTLERMLSVSPDHATSEMLLLELGELYLEHGDFEKAQEVYKLYGELYPGSTYLRDARFNEIQAHFACIQPAENDQTETHACITLANKFINEFPNETEYHARVIPLLKTCYYRLIEGEVIFARLHLRRFELDNLMPALNASKKRLRYIEEKIIPELARIDNQANHIRALVAEGATDQAKASDVNFALTGIEIILGKHEALHPRDTF